MGVQEPSFVAFDVSFFEFLTPSILGGYNFFNFILLLTIFSALDVPIRGLQIFFGHQIQWSPPFVYGLPYVFKCSIIDL